MNLGILVGGRGVRMGGPKASLLIHDRPLLDFVFQPFNTLGGFRPCFLGSAAIPPAYAHIPLIPDAELEAGDERPSGKRGPIGDSPDTSRTESDSFRAGPLAGILAALRHDAAPWLIVACDMPWITTGAIRWLVRHAERGAAGVLPRDGAGRVEPLLAIYTAALLPAIVELTCRGRGSPRLLADSTGVDSPEIPPELRGAWESVNSPEDLRRLAAGD